MNWYDLRLRNQQLGLHLKKARIEAGLTQSRLVTLLDPYGSLAKWNVPTLSQIEQGIMVPNETLGPILEDWLFGTCPTCGRDWEGIQ